MSEPAMTFTVNEVNFLPYLAFGGLEYQLSDIDDPDTGRMMNGLMRRGKISDKDKWKLRFRSDLTTAEISTILTAVTHQYVTATYLSPRTNTVITRTLYVGDRTAAHCIQRADGKALWKDLAFSLIER